MTGNSLSFLNRRWRLPQVDLARVDGFVQAGKHEVVATLLAARGFDSDTAEAFLDPTIKREMPDPYVLKDMKTGAERIARAIMKGEKIGIWSDYDVDGATSAAVLGSFLRMCNRPGFVLRIPDRIRDGYGPNTPGLLAMKHEEACDLVCILDAGIVAFEPLAAARAAGLEVVVIDHHAAEATVPEAVAVINPNRHDDSSGLGHLCAAGVTFLTAVAVTRILRKEGWCDGKEGRPETLPDLPSLLDLVALGTVCDVVPLKTLNRAFVRRGQAYLTRRVRPGIRELAIAAGIGHADEVAEMECGWKIGPRINAGGRIADSHLGALLLLEEDPEQARSRAEELDGINADRQGITGLVNEAAIAQLAHRSRGEDRTLALAIVEDAHEGVVGISAGRLRESYDAPAIVLARDHEGNLKGSARSVPGVDIGHIIIEARKRDLIVKGGGHGMAGGLTMRHDQVAAFIEYANSEIAQSDYARTGVVTDIDLVVPVAQVTAAMIDAFAPLRPFGTANPDPMVMLPGVVLAEIHIMKEKHIKAIFRDGRSEIPGLMWNAVGTALGDRIQAARGQRVDVIGKLSINAWRDKRNPQMMMEDLRLVA